MNSQYGLPTYVTIDLDTWMPDKVDIEMLDRTLSRVPKADRAAAIHHDSVLPHIRRYAHDTKRLVNLDFHSDLGGCLEAMFEDGNCGLRRLALHSGSWADYVALNDKQEFVWAYPARECLASGRTDHFSLERPFGQVRQVGRNPWRNIKHVLVKPPHYGLSRVDITGISIVLSPDFCGADAFEAFVGLVGRHDLELLDCLPQNLEAAQLCSLGERLRKRRSGQEEPLAVVQDWRLPRSLLRSMGFRCTTTRDRRKATESYLRITRSMWAKPNEPGVARLP